MVVPLHLGNKKNQEQYHGHSYITKENLIRNPKRKNHQNWLQNYSSTYRNSRNKYVAPWGSLVPS
jgi:hypothetical protein